MITRIVLGTLAVILLSACGGTDADVVDSKKSEAATSGASSSGDGAQKARLLESGFGQADQYAWVMALVKNESDHAGQTVTVNFNVKDTDGHLLASGSQVA